MNNNDWISVEDRLPELGERVLVWLPYVATEAYRKGDCWVRHNSNLEDYMGAKVTHWMQLPEPPREAE